MDPVYGPVVIWGGGFLVWTILGFIARAIGQRKNRPSIVLTAFFLMPLSLLLALLLPPRPLPAPTLAQCPYCRFIIPIDAQVCGHCRGLLMAPPDMVNVTPR